MGKKSYFSMLGDVLFQTLLMYGHLSSEEMKEKCKEYLKEDKREEVLHLQRKGLSEVEIILKIDGEKTLLNIVNPHNVARKYLEKRKIESK